MLGGEGHASLLPFLASLESGRVGETALARRLAERDEGTEFRHTIVGKTFHQREFGSPVVPCTQEAIVVSHIDNLSAKTDTWEGAGDMEYMNALGTKKVAPLIKN